MSNGGKIFIGIDGGATKAKGAAIDESRRVVAEETGDAANFQIIGVDRACSNIQAVVDSLLKKPGYDFSCIVSICMGLAGAGRKDDAEKIRSGYTALLRSRKLTVPVVIVESDAIAALEGAFAGKPGMILISGTGSILFAKEDDNSFHRVGGWGRFIGDEGSGYAIGRDAFTAVAMELDGRGDHTMITELLGSKKKIDSPQKLISEIYQNNFDIASAAPLVLEAAESGDGVAIEIIGRNVNQLIDHVGAMTARLKKNLPLVVAGGVLSSDNVFSRSFRKELSSRFPEIQIREPEFSPAVGAALIAYRSGGNTK